MLTIPSRQRLVSVKLSRAFQIRPEQHGNLGVAKALVARAAHQPGVAEDYVLLHGKNASDHFVEELASNHTDNKLRITAENLDGLDESDCLIEKDQESIVVIIAFDYCFVVVGSYVKERKTPCSTTLVERSVEPGTLEGDRQNGPGEGWENQSPRRLSSVRKAPWVVLFLPNSSIPEEDEQMLAEEQTLPFREISHKLLLT